MPRTTDLSARDSSLGSAPPAFDGAAARAQKEKASKDAFTAWKNSTKAPDPVPVDSGYSVKPPPILPRATYTARSYTDGNNRSGTYIPTADILVTRPVRIRSYYTTYYSRPVVIYRDPYSSLFWWWLLDQSLDTRAYWTYHHRYDMDQARYQALMTDDSLADRVRALERQQMPVNANFVPNGLEQDLMYSDHYIQRSYHTRPTAYGRVAFWMIMFPAGLGAAVFVVWLVFWKKWEPSR